MLSFTVRAILRMAPVWCRVRRKCVVNNYTPLDLQIDFFIRVFRQMDLGDVFILPALREIIERTKPKKYLLKRMEVRLPPANKKFFLDFSEKYS
jgi:hypothetical protein